MEKEFWFNCWKNNEIGFHESQPNPYLIKNINRLALQPHARLFVPLCGKTLDIGWLVSQGYRVAAVELSEMAIQQLFEAMNIAPEVVEAGTLKHYRADNIDIFVGDFFELTPELLGGVEAVFDRGSMVAFPEELRSRYADHMKNLTCGAPQLLVCFDYDQALRAGPPFSVSLEELEAYYTSDYSLDLIDSADLSERMNVNFPFTEKAWLLTGK